MRKAPTKKNNDDLGSEYDLSQLKGGVRGKYYREATAGTNLATAETHEDLIGLAAQVYDGLTEEEVNEVERLALERSSFFSRPTS